VLSLRRDRIDPAAVSARRGVLVVFLLGPRAVT
jgi:hypothetical protein